MNYPSKSIKSNNVLKMLVLAFFSIVASAAMAENHDLGALELNKAYDTSASGSYTGSYTATDNGTLSYICKNNTIFDVFADADHTTELTTKWGGYVNGGVLYSLNVEAGKTYYFYCDYSYGTGSELTLMFSNSLELVNNNYAEGATISAASTATISLQFSSSIKLDAVTMVAGENSVDLTSVSRINGVNLDIVYGDALRDWLSRGIIKAGDTVKFNVTGLCSSTSESVKYGDNGTLTLSYISAAKPVELVSATNGDGTVSLPVNGGTASINFLSYFREENANGKYVFTFSDALKESSNYALLIFGQNSESVEAYYETLPISFSDDHKTITVDCTGKLRSVNAMGGYNFGTISVKLQGVQSEDGQFIYTGTVGSEGSLSVNFNYSEITSTTGVVYTPGSEFGNATEIKMEISGYNEITYDGIRFESKENGVITSTVIDKADLKIVELTAYNAATVTVTIPEFYRTKKNVYVSFENLLFNDGQVPTAEVHSQYLPQHYNALELTVNSNFAYETYPADAATVESYNSLQITFSDYSNVCYNNGAARLSKKGSELNEALPVATTGMLANRMVQSINNFANDNGAYTVTFPEGYFMFDDNTVSSEFSVTVIVDNGFEEPEPSIPGDVNFKSIPADNAVVESCSQIDITFTDYTEAGLGLGKATISKDGGEATNLEDATYGTEYNEVIQPLSDTAAEAGTYTVSFPEGYFLLGEDGENSPAFTITFTVGVSGVDSITTDRDSATQYFNLQGVKVENPTSGLYIIKRGNTTGKAILK